MAARSQSGSFWPLVSILEFDGSVNIFKTLNYMFFKVQILLYVNYISIKLSLKTNLLILGKGGGK